MIELKKDDKQEQRDQEIEHLRVALKEAHEKIRKLSEQIAQLQLDFGNNIIVSKIEGEA